MEPQRAQLNVVETAPDIAAIQQRLVERLGFVEGLTERTKNIANALYGMEPEMATAKGTPENSAGYMYQAFDADNRLREALDVLDYQLGRLGRLV